MSREHHEVRWSNPRELSPEERIEYEGYVLTEFGVASPDGFTPEALAEAESAGRIITPVESNPEPVHIGPISP